MDTALEEGGSVEVDLVVRARDSLLTTEAGRKQVEAVLGRIEHGIF
jgi:uncharacterized protein (DUF2384 family)